MKSPGKPSWDSNVIIISEILWLLLFPYREEVKADILNWISERIPYILKRCSKKECCKQCRYVKPYTQNDTKISRTPWRNRHLEKCFFSEVWFLEVKPHLCVLVGMTKEDHKTAIKSKATQAQWWPYNDHRLPWSTMIEESFFFLLTCTRYMDRILIMESRDECLLDIWSVVISLHRACSIGPATLVLYVIYFIWSILGYQRQVSLITCFSNFPRVPFLGTVFGTVTGVFGAQNGSNVEKQHKIAVLTVYGPDVRFTELHIFFHLFW